MNTESTRRIKSLYELNPEVEEAINIIYSDVSYRLHNTIGILSDGNDRSDELKSFTLFCARSFPNKQTTLSSRNHIAPRQPLSTVMETSCSGRRLFSE